MNAALAKLSPGERRFVVGVALTLFIVINVFWVWPHFSDYSDLRSRGQAAEIKLANYQGVIQKADRLKPELSKMEGEGAAVLPEDQSVQFYNTIQAQAMKSGVQFLNNNRVAPRTNQFFIELVQTITVQATEKQLVDFLYNLGIGGSLIRARSLSVHPDPSRQQLNASITLIASYQKNPRTATAAPAPRTSAPPATAAPPPVPAPAPGSVPKPLPPGIKPPPAGGPAAAKNGKQKNP
jgi:hypothetical protein